MAGESDGYADFSFDLRPTYEFCLALLGMGDMVEVMKPASLREQMKKWLACMEAWHEE